MFKGYGKGVRRVSLESAGKDDKYWGGHYGTLSSAATIQVKRETISADGDCFSDIFKVHGLYVTSKLPITI